MVFTAMAITILKESEYIRWEKEASRVHRGFLSPAWLSLGTAFHKIQHGA
jgi:hypothetical protein